jgi:hypothetical protein
MLESNFHSKTIIYVDNAEMAEAKEFLKTISQNSKYQSQAIFSEKAVLITIKS